MFINHEYGFIFIHIPKNAGTSIRNSFELEGYDQKVAKKRYPHDPCSKIEKYCGEIKQDVSMDGRLFSILYKTGENNEHPIDIKQGFVVRTLFRTADAIVKKYYLISICFWR